MYKTLKNYFILDNKRGSVFSDFGIIVYMTNLKGGEFDSYNSKALEIREHESSDVVKSIDDKISAVNRNRTKQFKKYYPVPVISVLFNFYCQTIHRYTSHMDRPPKENIKLFADNVKTLYKEVWKDIHGKNIEAMSDRSVYKLFEKAYSYMLPDTEYTDKNEYLLKNINNLKSIMLISLNDCEAVEHDEEYCIDEVRDICIEILNSAYENY